LFAHAGSMVASRSACAPSQRQVPRDVDVRARSLCSRAARLAKAKGAPIVVAPSAFNTRCVKAAHGMAQQATKMRLRASLVRKQGKRRLKAHGYIVRQTDQKKCLQTLQCSDKVLFKHPACVSQHSRAISPNPTDI
jgi:hypothetical protein